MYFLISFFIHFIFFYFIIPQHNKEIIYIQAPLEVNIIDLPNKKTSLKESFKEFPLSEKKLSSKKTETSLIDFLKKEQKKADEVFKGNKLVKGSKVLVEGQVLDTEMSLILNHVRSYWYLPEDLLKKNDLIRIKIILDNKGFIKEKDIIEKKSSQEYLNRVLETLKKSEPFPIGEKEFILGFPL